MLSDKPRQTFRVEATGTSGVVSRRISAVWDKGKSMDRDVIRDKDGRGAWVFWREE